MERVIQVQRLDVPSDFVLLHIKRVNESLIDSQLLATDGNAPYFLSLVGQDAAKFRDMKHCTESDWVQALSVVLFAQDSGRTSVTTKGLEVVATSVSGDHIILTVRQKISDIAHRLGSITLDRDDDREIELFSWAGIAVQAASTRQKEIDELNVVNTVQKQTILKLELQLQEFATAKVNHERLLLEKFRELLNSKKLKIRDQQMLLASAKVDPAIAARVQASRSTLERRDGTISRSAKRKATTELKSEPLENIDIVEGMALDDEEVDDNSTINAQTPEPSTSEDTDEEFQVADPPPTSIPDQEAPHMSSSPLSGTQDLSITTKGGHERLVSMEEEFNDNEETDDEL